MHLFLSPHYDDAVLSCGGLIHQLARSGEAVEILTVMGGDIPDPLPDTPIVRDLHARWQAGHDPVKARREEDCAAANILGATAGNMPYPDCVYRAGSGGQPLYPSEESLFGSVHPDDPVKETALPQRVVHASHLYAPLGIGHHVDHQVVRDWVLALAARQAGVTLRLYEDYPYSRDRVKTRQALEYFRTLGVELCEELRWLAESSAAAKVEAAACYTSQISTFWPNLEVMEREMRQHMLDTGHGTFAERYYIWKMN